MSVNNVMTLYFVGKFGNYGHGWNPLQNPRPLHENQNLMITTTLALFDLDHRLCNLIGSYCNEWRPPILLWLLPTKIPLKYTSQYMMTICCFEQNLAIMSSLYPPLYHRISGAFLLQTYTNHIVDIKAQFVTNVVRVRNVIMRQQTKPKTFKSAVTRLWVLLCKPNKRTLCFLQGRKEMFVRLWNAMVFFFAKDTPHNQPARE